MKKIMALCAAVIIILPAAGIAQLNKGFGIGPRLGYYKAKDAEDGNFYGGIQARIRFGSVFGLEGAVDYRTDTSNDAFTVRQVPVTLSALLYLPFSDRFQPYGVAGLGSYYTLVDYDPDANNNANDLSDAHNVDFGYHLGFGLELALSRTIALNVDYRYLFLDPGSDEFGKVGDADLSGNLISASLMFYF